MRTIECVLESHGPCESFELSIVRIGLETTELRVTIKKCKSLLSLEVGPLAECRASIGEESDMCDGRLFLGGTAWRACGLRYFGCARSADSHSLATVANFARRRCEQSEDDKEYLAYLSDATICARQLVEQGETTHAALLADVTTDWRCIAEAVSRLDGGEELVSHWPNVPTTGVLGEWLRQSKGFGLFLQKCVVESQRDKVCSNRLPLSISPNL